MPNIKPFRALRPLPEFVEKACINHGDTATKEKALSVIEKNPYSILRISHGDATLEDFEKEGILTEEQDDCFYIYRLSLANHSQTGLVAAVDITDYIDGSIKRHELTRREKVMVQEEIINKLSSNIEPVLLTYKAEESIERTIEDWAASHDSLFDFFDDGGIRHEIWTLSDPAIIDEITQKASAMGSFYICDGHHRIEATATHYERTGESRFFMAAIFPSDEMLILDYNRAVKDLNGYTKDQFLNQLTKAEFKIEEIGIVPVYPSKPGEYSMILDGLWYRLTYTGIRDTKNPVAELDVSILQDHVLSPILGIKDPSHDDRISFISGVQGLEALQSATQSGMAVAFAINPPTMAEIFEVSDAGLTMPPKSTWFEPKLSGGLLILKF